jgi:hypothetical protein
MVHVPESLFSQDFSRRTFRRDPPLIHEKHPIGEAGRRIEMVRDENDGHPSRRRISEQAEDFHFVPHVEAGGGFVEDEGKRVLSEGTGNPNPLKFPTR